MAIAAANALAADSRELRVRRLGLGIRPERSLSGDVR
jgi:hypothetical protein